MKGKELTSLKEITGAETNPFVVELKGKMFLQPRANTIIARGQSLVDTNTGELISDDVLLGRRKIVDKSQFAKIYASRVGELYTLSKTAINVFIHLTKIMDFENKAIFDYRKEYNKLGYKTEVSALKGLRELITNGIIYPHLVNGIWWLNPTIVCKGERFAMYTEYVTKERHEEDMKRLAIKQLKEQGEDTYYSLDSSTQHSLNCMNKMEEEAYYKAEQNRIENMPQLPFDETTLD